MSNDFNREIITLAVDKGQEIVAETLDQMTTKDGKTYIAVLPVGEDFSDDDLYVLEKRVDKIGDEYIVDIEDDKTFEKVLETFIRRMVEKEKEQDEATVLKFEL